MQNLSRISFGWNVGNTQLVGQVLSENFTPLSFVSEYTRNSLQAIQRRGVGDTVVWGHSVFMVDGEPVKKLTITDNGPGLAEDPNEIRRLVGGMACSGYATGLHLNHGCGAKASAAMWNACGVIYRTWFTDRHGKLRAYQAAIGPEGPMQMDNGEAVIEIDPNEQRPDVITNHGTQVIFMGNRESQDTTVEVGQGTRLGGYKIFKYLNSRFYDIPEDIEVWAPRGLKTKDGDPRVDRVVGFRRCWTESGTKRADSPLLMDHGVARLDQIELPCNVHYFVFNEEHNRRLSREGIFDARYGIAFLYEDELYTHRAGPKSLGVLQAYVGMACDRVVLLIEPDTDRINPEGGREVLRYKGADLDLEIWSNQFRNSLPQSIVAVQEKKRRSHDGKFDSETLSKHLQPFYPELAALGGVRSMSGAPKPGPEGNRPPIAEGDPPEGESANGDEGAGGEEQESEPKPKISDVIQQITPSLKKIKAKSAAAKFPGCQWVSAEPDKYANTDEKPEDYLNGRAAFYDPYENEVRANWDFFLPRYLMLCDQYTDFMAAYGEDKVKLIIQVEMQDFYAHVFSDTIGALLVERNGWEPQDWELAAGEIGLTAAVMGRSRIQEISDAVNKRLEAEFGRDQKMRDLKKKKRRRIRQTAGN